MIRQHASVDGQRRLDALEEMTTVSAVARYAYDDFDDYLDSALADVLASPEVLEVFDDLRLGKNVPDCPLLVLQSVNDQIIDVDDVDVQVGTYVDGGARVRYLRDRLSEHISLMVIGMPTMLDWLEQRFLGGEAPTGTSTVSSVAGSARAWAGYLHLVGSTARTLVGRA